VLAVCIGSFLITSARHELAPYHRASVPVRIGFAVALTGLVVAGMMPRSLLLFAAIDLLGAVWTAFALRGTPGIGATVPAL
jgi:hypothetical protein